MNDFELFKEILDNVEDLHAFYNVFEYDIEHQDSARVGRYRTLIVSKLIQMGSLGTQPQLVYWARRSCEFVLKGMSMGMSYYNAIQYIGNNLLGLYNLRQIVKAMKSFRHPNTVPAALIIKEATEKLIMDGYKSDVKELKEKRWRFYDENIEKYLKDLDYKKRDAAILINMELNLEKILEKSKIDIYNSISSSNNNCSNYSSLLLLLYLP